MSYGSVRRAQDRLRSHAASGFASPFAFTLTLPSIVAFAFVVSFAWGCAPDAPPKSAPREAQSYVQAITLICEVDRHTGADPDDVLDVSARREDYLIEHVKNSDGIYFLTLFRVNGPKEQARMLEKEAEEVKVRECPLLATLRESSAPEPIPKG